MSSPREVALGRDFEASVEVHAATCAPSMVVYQPANLCADAIAAAVRMHTHWRVVCATTHVGEATAAALRCRADALVFDSRSGSAAAIGALIRSLRTACPNVPLVLLTEHRGVGFLRAAAAARVAVVDKGEPIELIQSVLEAIERRLRLGAVPASGRRWVS